MTDRLLEKIAAVLEATADDYDAREAEYARKLSSAREELGELRTCLGRGGENQDS